MTHRQLLKALTTTALDSFTTAPYGGGNQLIFVNVNILTSVCNTDRQSTKLCRLTALTHSA